MATKSISRRDILKIADHGSDGELGAAGDSGAGGRIRAPHGGGGKGRDPGGRLHAEIFLAAADYKTLQALCQTIIPADS